MISVATLLLILASAAILVAWGYNSLTSCTPGTHLESGELCRNQASHSSQIILAFLGLAPACACLWAAIANRARLFTALTIATLAFYLFWILAF